MTLAAAVEPAGREKIKLKGRQLLSKHNRDHIGVAVGHDAQDTGFLPGEAEIFVKVDDYSTNPNAHRDPQTGQWYMFDPVTKKCKWVVRLGHARPQATSTETWRYVEAAVTHNFESSFATE